MVTDSILYVAFSTSLPLPGSTAGPLQVLCRLCPTKRFVAALRLTPQIFVKFVVGPDVVGIKLHVMKIFPVKAIAEMDAYTIENEPILSVNLMERASRRLFDRIKEPYAGRPFLVLAGPGNNGGDALVLARMLALNEFLVRVVF